MLANAVAIFIVTLFGIAVVAPEFCLTTYNKSQIEVLRHGEKRGSVIMCLPRDGHRIGRLRGY